MDNILFNLFIYHYIHFIFKIDNITISGVNITIIIINKKMFK